MIEDKWIELLFNFLLENAPKLTDLFLLKKNKKKTLRSNSVVDFIYQDDKKKQLGFIVVTDKNGNSFWIDVELNREIMKKLVDSVISKEISKDEAISLLDLLSKYQSKFYN